MSDILKNLKMTKRTIKKEIRECWLEMDRLSIVETRYASRKSAVLAKRIKMLRKAYKHLDKAMKALPK